MRIVLDVSSLPYGTGVSVYVRELVRAFAKMNHDHHFVLFAGAWAQQDFFRTWFAQEAFDARFSLKILPLPPRVQAILWNDFHVLKAEWLLGAFDVYHSTDWSLPPSAYSRVISVHDLFFLKRPDLQQHPFAETLRKRLERGKNAELRAIAVSQTTKKDLVELIGYPEDLIDVVYEAAKPLSPTHTAIESLKQKFGIRNNYLLMVSTREPRKNMQATIQAFSKLSTDTYLVVVGKDGWGQSYEQCRNVIFTGYLSDEELTSLLNHASGLVYPSLYEGFGLPILEAFEVGIPVLTSSVSSMPEVAGKAAIYVDPYSIESMYAGLARLISLSQDEKEQLVREGKKQFAYFSWEKAAKETLTVYEKSR